MTFCTFQNIKRCRNKNTSIKSEPIHLNESDSTLTIPQLRLKPVHESQTERGSRRNERRLVFIRGIPVKVVGHEENVRSSGDQSVARFHHLEAQKAERTHQFHQKRTHTHTGQCSTRRTHRGVCEQSLTYHDRPCSYRSRRTH